MCYSCPLAISCSIGTLRLEQLIRPVTLLKIDGISLNDFHLKPLCTDTRPRSEN
ncbi:hypothetical protein BDV23DRAFT_148226 [Aspergillus alliaceus]|uniref:Uncharacterized protein n=1 Tax=Petromyces alliaceus TaxID=209559 RepID=A0A5N7CIC0_PETAA|nr:hypothetical protein BDV23DRAFT_148226 [Aspergillus alliaceus]